MLKHIRQAKTSGVLVSAIMVAATVCGSGSDRADVAAASPVAAASANSGQVRIERLDPRLDRLIPREAVVEKIVDGQTWVEGPVWDKSRKSLLFSDIPRNAVYEWREGERPTIFLKPSGYTGTDPFTGAEPGSNGLTMDSGGRLVLAQHGDRQISRLNDDGSTTTLVDRYHGKRLNSPNDLAYKSNGDLYFTDPPFGLPKTFDDPTKELPYQGVYRLAKNGKLTLLTKDIEAPNGIAFSPDEKTLYVTDVSSENPAWWAFPVKSNGTLGHGRVFARATPFVGNGPGVPDGLKVDKHGNLFSAGPGGVYIFAPDGTHLGTIALGTKTSNTAWGEDGSTLFITADHAVYRVELATSGTIPG
ncbi:SMP-30/gluconolactonase/LRE family protein [Streptomyces sp. NPDC019990]|uniref:SMP-30/gluconolactonase/LRE family protein n=1 Tax=Streptomyces sp. NPDC019990 TaxID=3154693 RepID=UPI0033EF5B3F